MPVPRVITSGYKPNDWSKIFKIMRQLDTMGYHADGARNVVLVIEKVNIDKSQFDFPYGSFEEFKKHTSDGEFDIDENKYAATDASRKKFRKELEEGRICLTC